MKLFNKYIFFCALVALAILPTKETYAQEDSNLEKKINKLIEKNAWDAVVEKLTHEKGIEDNMFLQKQLGLAYLKTNDYAAAEQTLANLKKTNPQDAEILTLYLQAANGSDKQAETKASAKALQSLNPENPMGLYGEDIYTPKLLLKARVEKVNFNSKFSDYSITPYGDEYVFLSEWPQNKKKKKSAWTGRHYTNLFVVSAEGIKQKDDISQLAELNTNYFEGPTVFNADKTVAFITRSFGPVNHPLRNKKGEVRLAIYRSENQQGRWTKPKLLPFCEGTYNMMHPAVSKDGRMLYFASDIPGGLGKMDLYKCSINPDGTYGKIENLGPEINSFENEAFPVINGDGLLYFSSARAGGRGALDIYVYDKKGTVRWLKEPINSAADDFGFIFGGEKFDKGYLSSNRDTDLTFDDIFFVEKIVSKKTEFESLVTVVNATTGATIEGINVLVRDASGTPTAENQTNAKGQLAVALNPNEDFKLVFSGENYFEKEMIANVPNQDKLDEVLRKVELKPKKTYTFTGFTRDAIGSPIAGVKASILDLNQNVIASAISDATGKYTMEIEAEEGTSEKLLVKYEKDDYLSTTEEATFLFMDETTLAPKEIEEIQIFKIEKDMDLAKALKLEPIYFDSGSASIKKESTIELDKVIQAMSESPEINILLGSHTDSKGKKSQNEALSQKRAEATASYLITNGIAQSRIQSIGFGESQLINKCADGVKCTDEEHAQNRRTEFKIVSF